MRMKWNNLQLLSTELFYYFFIHNPEGKYEENCGEEITKNTDKYILSRLS